MATEEEPREAADGKEVQVEAVDSEPLHMHTHLDSKLSSMEIKKVAETIDSTEEKLKIPEVQVLVDAPSEIKLQLEHNLNGTSSSLNGHMDEEIKVSNEQLHKDSKKDPEQAEAALHGESTDQNNKINKEANDSLSHGENTIEDSSLLRHDNEDEPKRDDQQDKDPMQDTLKTNSNMDQTKLVDRLDMDPAKATEGTQPGMENIPNADVVTEAHAEVQISLGPNLTDSDAFQDTVDRSTETDEVAVEDSAIHLEHRESYPDDISSDKHTEDVVKCGAMDADVAQEDIPKCEETGVLEETPESEHADVPTIVAQEVLHQDDKVEDEIDLPVDMEQEQEEESLETSGVLEVQGLGTTEQTRGIEATETEDHQQHRVSTLEEPIVDNKPVVDDYQVHEEKPAELNDNEVMEAEPVLEQSSISTPDNAPEERSELGNDPESLRDSEDSKLLKEKEISDQKSITREDTATENNVEDEIDPPVGMEQVQEQESVETSDVQKVQELGTTEQTRRNEAMETEDHQQHRVCTLQEPAVGNKQDVDDHQVNEERPAEHKGNEAMEPEQVLEQSNISTPDNAPEERSELENDPGCCVQPALQVESSKDSEDSKLLKEEVTSDEKIITLEDTATKYNVEDEIDPPVGMEQEDEQKSVEEVKDIDANEAKENFHTSQIDTLDKLASESSTTTSELKYDIQHLNDFEMKETRSIEGVNDGDISREQREIASADPPPTNNEIAPQEHPVESHEDNLGNEAENAMLARGMKDEIQTSAEHKDDAIYLDESVSTTKKSKNLVDEDVIQSYGEDTLENSSQRSSEHHAENIAHVQDKDINRELVTERGTAEASQALIENNAQASQDITENDDTMKTGEQTNDHRQAGDAEYLPQTCESSVDAEVVQKVSLDEDKRHKEDEAIESQQLQADEQKVKDEGDDVSNEPLVESKDTEIRTTNRTEETDMLEAEQTEAVINETPKIEQALNTSEDSTPSITDTTVEDITGTDKGVEEENRLNSANTSDVDAQMDKQEDDENTGKDNILPKDPTSGQEETADEITNEEDPITVPYNAESGEYEHKECANKVNDDLLAIQEPVKEIAAEMQENKEMRNGTKGVHHVESHTKAEEKEMSQQCSNEPNKVDTKIDDTTHNATVNPIEIGDIGENNVEQDLSIHHKVEDEKLESKVDNDVELEAMQQKVDTSNVYANNDDHLSVSNSLSKHETESADDALQLETEGNTFDKADETVSHEKKEASNTSVPEIVTFNEEICDKVTGAEEGLSDESLKTFHGTSRNIDVSSVVIESNEKSTNVDIEDHKLAVPEHSTMDENTPKQEKPLPADPEEQEDDPRLKKQDEEGMHEPDFGDDQKEVEQDLPVSNFLMNLILGKENSDANGHSEPEVETKQEETRDDNSCLIIPKQVENLALPPIENNVEDKLAIEQETNDVNCPEEKQEVVEEQSRDLKLGTKTSLETDSELNKNSHDLELPPCQDKVQDEISNEILPEEAAEVFTKMEGKDTTIPNIKQDDGEADTVGQEEADTVGQENIEVATQNVVGSLKNNLDDLNNTKTPDEDTLGEGQIRLLPECLNDARSVNSVTEQTFLSTELVMTNAKSLPSEDDSVPNPVCEIQDKTIESSSIIAASIPDIQVESEEDRTEEKQPTTTARGQVAEEHVEISNDNRQKSIGPEATSNGQEPQISEQVSDTEIALGHGKEVSEGSSSTFIDNKEDSNISVKGDNIQTAVEIQADGSNMQINQDEQEAADNKNEMESETLEESSIQEKQGNGTEEISPKECHEEDQQFSVKKEIAIKEGDVHETVKIQSDTVKIKANDEQELSDSKVQERDLSVLSPKDVREPEESFVDTAKPEFSTDEERSPRADESNISEKKTYEGKIKDEERIKNFTDEEVKTEAQVAEQKAAHKKQNLLSGVGSKVKHQLAKVKKAITGKPGNTKPKSPKA